VNLKVKVLTRQKIFNNKPIIDQHTKIIQKLNDGELDGLIIINEVANYGFNMINANNVIFIESIYSIAYEK